MVGLVAQREHRLDGERHALLEGDVVAWLVVVEDDQPGVEGRVHPVAGVVADHAVAEPLGVVLDDASDDADGPARTHRLDGAVHGLLGVGDEVTGLLADVATQEGVAVVTVHTVLVGGHVDLDDVAVLQRTSIRDAVADDVVDAGADGLGIVAVVQGGGVRPVIAHVLVGDPVELVGGDSGGHCLAGLVHGPTGDTSGLVHGLDDLGALHMGPGVVLRHVALAHIGRALDGTRDGQTRGNRVSMHGSHEAPV